MRIEPLFFGVIAVIGLAVSPALEFVVTFVVLAFMSVLLHELGHAVAFRAFGHSPAVVLQGMGGLTYATGRLSPWRSIGVSLAGPMAALVILGLPAWAALAAGVGDGSDAVYVVLAQAVWINVVWSALNLLPLLPLDGGNVAASLLELVTERNGRRIANGLSVVLAVALAVWALSMGFIFAVAVAGFFGFWNGRELLAGRHEDLAATLGASERALVAGDVSSATRAAESVLASRPKPAQAAWALELVAWCRLSGTDVAGAGRAVSDRRARPSSYLQGALALARGSQDEGVAVLAWAFANDGRTVPRLLGAAAAAAAGVIGPLADELVRLDGPTGRGGAVALRDALERFGRSADARQVAARLAG